jgi:DNA repair protein SbcC/Rad50
LIKELSIQNFQSHRDTILKFHPGFNSIVGSTDSGKSAIYRSIFWTRFNKAVNFISFWNRKKDGSPIDPSSVTIRMEDGSICRERSQTLNGYRINGQDPLEAIGRGEPPEQVSRLLNTSDINFFSQHNPPFLLTKSAGEVATILNDLIHLSDIDRVLSNVDRIKRANKKELEQNLATNNSLSSDLITLSWIDSATEALRQAEQTEIDLTTIHNSIAVLLPIYEQYRRIDESMEGIEIICNNAQPLIDKIDKVDKELKELMLRYSELERVASSLRQMEEDIVKLKKLDVSDDIVKYDNIQNELDSIADAISGFTSWITMYTAKEQIISKTEEELNIAKKELEAIPVCSECGKPLEDCDD